MYWSQSSAICFDLILKYCGIFSLVSNSSIRRDFTSFRRRNCLLPCEWHVILKELPHKKFNSLNYDADWKVKYCTPKLTDNSKRLKCTRCSQTYLDTEKWNQICSFQYCTICNKNMVFIDNRLSMSVTRKKQLWKCTSCTMQVKTSLNTKTNIFVDNSHVKLRYQEKQQRNHSKFRLFNNMNRRMKLRI